LRIELPLQARVSLLMQDYDFFVKDVPAFCDRLNALRALRGNEVVNGWQEAAKAGRIEEVVRDLLVRHYDPVYLQSMQRNFMGFEKAEVVEPADGSVEVLAALAARMTLPLPLAGEGWGKGDGPPRPSP
jgi:tRNA 2-selenouridine synthase